MDEQTNQLPAQLDPTGRPIRLLNELSDVVAQMHASLSLHDVLQILADRARLLVGAEVAVATQVIEGDRTPEISATSRSAAADRDGRTTAPLDMPGPWQEVRRTNRPLRLDADAYGKAVRAEAAARDAGTPGKRDAGIGRGPRARCGRARVGWLGAPLVGPDGRNIGVIQLVDGANGPFSADDEAIVVSLARMASVAVENARLYRAAVEARAKLGWAAHVDRVRAAELRAVIEGIGEAILVFDAHGRVTLSNAAADRLFSAAPIATLDDLHARLESDRDDATGQFQARLATDPERWLDVRVYPVAGATLARAGGNRAGEPVGDGDTGRIAVIRDVTSERRERLHREAFLGILSHEIRTPITTVYAGSKVLARDDAIQSATRRELAADISAEAERLFRLVEDLLVMTRAERGSLVLDREPVLLRRLVASTVRLEQAHFPQTRFVLHGPPDLPAVAGDALHVEQVVRNLLSNAGKYGPPGVDVDVEVGEEADGVAVRVLDRGPGLADGADDALFELAFRSPTTAAQAAGAGIGLFVCRRLVTSMGGRIWARPRDGGGAEFGFVLPRFDAD